MRTRNPKCFVCGASLADKQYSRVTTTVSHGSVSHETWVPACPGKCAAKLSAQYMKEKNNVIKCD